MTMPKFESVATAMVNQHGTRWMHWKADLAHGTNLHTADQLTEAYEAGVASLDAEVNDWRSQAHRSQSEADNAIAECDQLRAKLAAEQAKNVGLREKVQKFIDSLEECTDFEGFTAYIATMDDYHEAVEALSTQSDTSALEAIVKKVDELVRERCIGEFLNRTHGYAKGIRALPAVTLEDLK